VRRLYKPLKYVLVTFIVLGVLWPLVQGCVLGAIRREGCKWQPVVAFVDTYYPWIVLFFFVLGGLTWVARQDYRRAEETTRAVVSVWPYRPVFAESCPRTRDR
jgi:hypothetical protein